LETGNVDVRRIVTDIAESYKTEAGKKRINFEMTFDLPEGKNQAGFVFNTDPEKLKLILSNLLNNAVKFSTEDQRVCVSTVYKREKLTISVHNFGKHIPDDYKLMIFDRFKRIDSSITSMNRGHGLGLSVVASLADLLGGEISFLSNPTDGTTFTLSVPETTGKINSTSASVSGNEIFFEDNDVF
jgi:signal transduction histidine kinase